MRAHVRKVGNSQGVIIPKALLESHIASLSKAKLEQLDVALQFSLGLV